MANRIRLDQAVSAPARLKLAQAVHFSSRMVTQAFLFSLLATSALFAALETAPSGDTIDTSAEGYYSDFGEAKKAEGHSIAPVVGYDPTYRFVVGAAYFYEKPGMSFGLDANTNFGGVMQAHLRAVHEFATRWNYELAASGMKGFEAYYGEGGETSPATYQQLWGNRFSTRIQLSRRMTEAVMVGVFTDIRTRSEEPGGGATTFARVSDDEAAMAAGVSLKLDSRKDKHRSNDGVVLTTELTQSLTGLSSPSRKPFTQLESSFVVYKDVMGDFFPGVVAAFRVMGGISDGDVPFTFRYRFGGANKLRGYLENRFRGTKYYLQQTELRVPIWRMIGGALSLGFGDITDREFTTPKMCYGVGLRIGLPPDWVSQVRVDVGFARDQMGVFAEFGQTF